MKIAFKKIIAREFLILILTIIVSVFAYFGTILFNVYIESKIDNISEEISAKEILFQNAAPDYDRKKKKQNWLFTNFSATFNSYKSDGLTTDKLWERLETLVKNDSIEYKWKHVWEKELIDFNAKMGFPTPEKFRQFIILNSLNTEDSKQLNKAESIQIEIRLLESEKNHIQKLTENQKLEFTLEFLVWTFIITFGCRYLFYATKWSIKTLKEV